MATTTSCSLLLSSTLFLHSPPSSHLSFFNLSSSRSSPISLYPIRSKRYFRILSKLSLNDNNRDDDDDTLHFTPFSAVKPFFLLCTSVALSFSLFAASPAVESASAFVVSTPKKLQTAELATVRLFQENTPSVVYITNLAVRYLNLISLWWISFWISSLRDLRIGLMLFELGRTRLHWTFLRYLKALVQDLCGISKVILLPITMLFVVLLISG